jgi:hypothetical protein
MSLSNIEHHKHLGMTFNSQFRVRRIIVHPARHIGKVFCWRCPSRLQCITTSRTPPPRMRQIVCKSAFKQFNNMLANIRQQLERMPIIA